MPCDSGYLAPNERERELQRTAKLLVFASKEAGRLVDPWWEKEAKDCYCQVDLVPQLCRLLASLRSEDFERIVYNARNKDSRDLADWWERHEAADQARIQRERELDETRQLRESAISKLTPAEKLALGIK